MLLRFAVENHLSICERQELSFAASSLKDRSDGLIKCKAVDSGAVVPAVVIYGANASGKTNFVQALLTMKMMVLWSQIRGKPGGGVTCRKYLLDPSFRERPSCFEIDFVVDGIRYHYGFEATDEAFTSEWLYAIPKAHRRRLYERKNQNFAFGRWLKGQNRNIAELTRSNSLFLSAAAQNGHRLLSRVYEFFIDITFSDLSSIPGFDSSSQFKIDSVDDRVIDFLKSINTGVIGYRKRETELSEEIRSINREIKEVLERIVGGTVVLKPGYKERIAQIELAHRGRNGEAVHFDFDFESAGTRRLLVILGQIYKAIDKGLPIVIDELDASLHTYVCEAILQLFCSPKVNNRGAQLIATTHDTNLMRSKVLRRDQLWFAEKNIEGATDVYPLTDIQTRKGDNVELGYLQGRYGAVPIDDPVAASL